MNKDLIKQFNTRRDYLAEMRTKQFDKMSKTDAEIYVLDVILLALEHDPLLNELLSKCAVDE